MFHSIDIDSGFHCIVLNARHQSPVIPHGIKVTGESHPNTYSNMISNKILLLTKILTLALLNVPLASTFTASGGVTSYTKHLNLGTPFASSTKRNLFRISPTSNRKLTTKLQMNISNGTPPPYPVRVAVIGGGNFALALATVAARQNIQTTLLLRDEATAERINKDHKHPRYMSDITLPKNVRATADPELALKDATYIIHAVPVQYSRTFLDNVKDYIPAGVPVLSASKGIETTSLGFMVDILKECLGEDRSYAFLSGPSFAREICEGVATAVVIASEDLLLADDLAGILSSDNFRVFTTKDVAGVEIGGAVKNVIALAAGMCEGLGLGTNAMSGLVTRGCSEMRRLGVTLGARPSTISGLSGEFVYESLNKY